MKYKLSAKFNERVFIYLQIPLLKAHLNSHFLFLDASF